MLLKRKLATHFASANTINTRSSVCVWWAITHTHTHSCDKFIEYTFALPTKSSSIRYANDKIINAVYVGLIVLPQTQEILAVAIFVVHDVILFETNALK